MTRREAEPMAWMLVRQDEHGSRFEVRRFDRKEDAERAMHEYESGYPHHQAYFVLPSPDEEG